MLILLISHVLVLILSFMLIHILSLKHCCLLVITIISHDKPCHLTHVYPYHFPLSSHVNPCSLIHVNLFSLLLIPIISLTLILILSLLLIPIMSFMALSSHCSTFQLSYGNPCHLIHVNPYPLTHVDPSHPFKKVVIHIFPSIPVRMHLLLPRRLCCDSSRDGLRLCVFSAMWLVASVESQESYHIGIEKHSTGQSVY